jgi:hypothetical protein
VSKNDLEKKLFFVGILKATEEMSRYGSGSISKPHGSGTLLKIIE